MEHYCFKSNGKLCAGPACKAAASDSRLIGLQIAAQPDSFNPRGRPKGFDGTKSKQPSALAQAFKKAGLDWKIDFADAIRARDKERIALWLKLLPYMITTSKRAKVKKWKGRASKAALVALEAMEQDI